MTYLFKIEKMRVDFEIKPAREIVPRNEAAKRLGIPVCEVCSGPECQRRRHGSELNAVLCNACYIDWLKHEVRREIREKGESKP